MLERTCPLDSIHHLESVKDRKQCKEEYLQILSELEHLGVLYYYNTIELSVVGHYLLSSLSALYKTLNFINYSVSMSQ